ncbi:MAG TPA: c-type cytochrome [Ectothiorhodospiraceae bacterium]|nr:c-type cytochrome [Ectothiorhodospiraceae bacterium]
MMKYLLIVALGVFLIGCEAPTPEQLRERNHLPKIGFVADTIQGRALFNSNCASCHGTAANGTENGPPLIDKTYNSLHHADLAFHWAVRDGVRQHHWRFGDMPKVANLRPEDVGHIVAFVRKEQRLKGIK